MMMSEGPVTTPLKRERERERDSERKKEKKKKLMSLAPSITRSDWLEGNEKNKGRGKD